MNNYRYFVNDGMCSIHFTGQIGTYWRDGKIEVPVNNLSETEINEVVVVEVEKNKVFKNGGSFKICQ